MARISASIWECDFCATPVADGEGRYPAGAENKRVCDGCAHCCDCGDALAVDWERDPLCADCLAKREERDLQDMEYMAERDAEDRYYREGRYAR